MQKKKILIFSGSALILILLIIIIVHSFVFVHKCSYFGKIGIIDDCLSNEHSNIIYYQTNKIENIKKSHGDLLIDFLEKYNFEGNIYYFAAVDSSGKITSEQILNGLEWMYKNEITKVNISLSSAFYNKQIDEWIQTHPDVQIYSSYNNDINSVADYPAMYENVIASGSDSRIKYKNNDSKYSSNKVIILYKNYYYVGNSYLSLLTMLKSNEI